MDFIQMQKIPRLSREIIITEKIDGTNAAIHFELASAPPGTEQHGLAQVGDILFRMRVGSRTRWITPFDDNHGFARWAYQNIRELTKLGLGMHRGEWWGAGINRGYGLTEKRFSLFNTGRWNASNVPECCHVVPVLHQGLFDSAFVDYACTNLAASGSVAAPGYRYPEGIVVYHTAANALFKKTIGDDEVPKSARDLVCATPLLVGGAG